MSIKDPKGVGDFIGICFLILIVGVVVALL